MSTCKSGDQPKVTYSFNNAANKIFVSPFSPIDVVTKSTPVSATNNYSSTGYKITFYATQCSNNTCSFVVQDYMTFYKGNILYLVPLNCGATDYSKNSDGSYANTFALDAGSTSITMDTTSKCPGAAAKERCSLQVVHNGQILFQDQGDCPVNYSVQCGKCPDGTCECFSPVYPGYCCLDCAATAANIRAITNELKAKNS